MAAILELWRKKQADQIVGLIGRFIANPDNPSRQIHRPDEVDIKGMIQAGEKFVRNWRA